MYEGITPVHSMDGYYVKREDLACWHDLNHPSGSKVRQYFDMSINNGAPCIVGCSANSAMAIYVASTAKLTDKKGIIYTAGRKKRTEGIKYAAEMGAEIVEVKPGYLSLIRARARARAIELSDVVKWSPQAAIEDTIKQCENIPEDVKRIVVPTGSGLTAAGVAIGVRRTWIDRGWHAPQPMPVVIVVATSTMANLETIIKRADCETYLPDIEFIGPTSSYNDHEIAMLPDGTPLDPYYSSKAFKYLQPNDLFWPVGLRPIRSMPDDCKEAFKNWKGPK